QEIKGRADAEAANIYANAYDQSSASRELYSFIRSMEAYQNVFDNQTSIILSTDSDFYKYLNSIGN
ncbi:MAG TPA: hypothetical protein VJ905_03035, partial [Halalkalibaculum sp.]|nr:hypothetical protein [Halalkalibaculum sp.]